MSVKESENNDDPFSIVSENEGDNGLASRSNSLTSLLADSSDDTEQTVELPPQ